MRMGLLSDVHANWPALQAVLRRLDELGVDRVVVAGDIVGYGGQPNECVNALAEAGAECVAGNHELYLLDRLPDTRFQARARESLEVNRRLVTADVREFLAALPLRLRIGGVLVTHGSLDSAEEYVRGEARALEQLERLSAESPGADTLVLGHTHRQACVLAGRGAVRVRGRVDVSGVPRLLNPGSVGQSRQRERRPRARFAVYDDAAGRVEFRHTDYDVAAGLEAVRRLGLPERNLHAPPRVRHRVGGLVARMTGRR